MIVCLRKSENEVLEGLRALNRLNRDGGLPGEVGALRRELEDLKIARDRLTETHAREERDLRHMIGLEKKRQEFEVDAGKKEAVLAVRQENLDADRKRFTDEMKFQRERFEQEVGYLKAMLGQILDRLPNVEVGLTGRIPKRR